ncbi:hypothetical protein PHMEG_00021619 [Phytophthora megakarya]|uniref:Reverse transcriptase domain-containing protein n=1 Tax=Phytophthora megakarya TaxID=4795 RepID=A0A225VL56_9STRA|nr:hypothetical protein PHMEG_00021619 [Phytophthora megakarya]
MLSKGYDGNSKVMTQDERWRYASDASNGTTEMGGANVNLLHKRGVESTAASEIAGDMVRASDGLPTATVWVDGQRQSVKIDSGARYSVAGTDWILRGERLTQRAPVDHVEGIGGLALDVLGVWSFEVVNVFGQTVSLIACILDGCTDEFLIGVDFLERHRATIDFEGSELRYSESRQDVVIPFRTDDGQNGSRLATVRLVRAVNLQRCAVQPVEVSVTAPDGAEGIFLPSGGCGAVMLAAVGTKVRNGKAPVPVINTHGGRVKLPSRRELGEWFPLDADMNVLEMNGELQRQRMKSWLSELGNDKDPLENEDDVNIGTGDAKAKELVIRLLRSYRNLMNTETAFPPATTVNVEHPIDTGNTSPIMLKRRHHAQTEDATVDEYVDEMLGAEIVEESDGAWGFSVVLVKKRDGSVRFCVDYRALNRVTKRDVYPLPRIDETLEAFHLLFPTLDLRSGYWQIKVAQEDRDKTAFITKRGLYRFTRMPFGLTNAPATFQRLMNGVLRGLTWSTCLVYLDDIVVYTRGGIERHVVELAAVLERLSAAGLTLKL